MRGLVLHEKRLAEDSENGTDFPFFSLASYLHLDRRAARSELGAYFRHAGFGFLSR